MPFEVLAKVSFMEASSDFHWAGAWGSVLSSLYLVFWSRWKPRPLCSLCSLSRPAWECHSVPLIGGHHPPLTCSVCPSTPLSRCRDVKVDFAGHESQRIFKWKFQNPPIPMGPLRGPEVQGPFGPLPFCHWSGQQSSMTSAPSSWCRAWKDCLSASWVWHGSAHKDVNCARRGIWRLGLLQDLAYFFPEEGVSQPIVEVSRVFIATVLDLYGWDCCWCFISKWRILIHQSSVESRITITDGRMLGLYETMDGMISGLPDQLDLLPLICTG